MKLVVKVKSTSTTSSDWVEESSMAGMHVENGDVFPMIDSLRRMSWAGVMAWGEPGASRLQEPPLNEPDLSGLLLVLMLVSMEFLGTRKSPVLLFSMLKRMSLVSFHIL